MAIFCLRHGKKFAKNEILYFINFYLEVWKMKHLMLLTERNYNGTKLNKYLIKILTFQVQHPNKVQNKAESITYP